MSHLSNLQVRIRGYHGPSSILNTLSRQVPSESSLFPFEALNKTTQRLCSLHIDTTAYITIYVLCNLHLQFSPTILNKVVS